MKKLFTICCIVAIFAFILAKPMNANAATNQIHEHVTHTESYLFGKVTVDLDWDYIHAKEILFSSGHATATGFAIYADTYMYANWNDESHYYKTAVTRGIDGAVSVGSGEGVSPSIGGSFTWLTDEFYDVVTDYGNHLSSSDGSFE